MKFSQLLAAILFLGCITPAFGLSLEEAVRMVWTKAPQLKAQRKEWDLAERDRWRIRIRGGV